MSPSLQVRPQLLVVVNLAVENHLDRTIFIADRLVAAAQIDDRESAMDQSKPRLDPGTFRVGTAMSDTVAHGPEDGLISRTKPVGIKDASDPAHELMGLRR